MQASIGVVIPFFQRQTGILARALRSVAAQSGIADVRVVIVDDESPVPARHEVAGLEPPFPMVLDIIEQLNGGPGAARNRALDFLTPHVDYIAFLDSDDEWNPFHLQRACIALGHDSDVFFGDHMQLGAEVTAFKRAGRIAPTQHTQLDGPGDIYAYSGDMFAQILRGNVIGTSTVVFDRKRFPGIRFREEYKNAGEDYLFWMELANAGARFTFSTQCEATYGPGVNIYASAGWGTEMHFLRLHNEIRFKKAVGQMFPVSEEQQRAIGTDLDQLREVLIRDLAHRLLRGKGIPWPWLRAHIALDPKTFASVPKVAFKILSQR